MVGLLMMFAALGWLTFLAPPLATDLSPYNRIPGILGEASLTLWLLILGVSAERSNQQARTAQERQI
jgi:hypothetical protein